MANFVMIRHIVLYYPYWREIFDQNQKMAQEYGLHTPLVFRDQENQNNITIIFSSEDTQKAQEFFSSPFLKQAMKRAGVVIDPEITFLSEIV